MQQQVLEQQHTMAMTLIRSLLTLIRSLLTLIRSLLSRAAPYHGDDAARPHDSHAPGGCARRRASLSSLRSLLTL